MPLATADAAAGPNAAANDVVADAAARDVPASAAHAQRCEVHVGKLTAANKYSGNKLTPADYARLDRDPAQARFENGISHGAQHIECTFDVTVNGASYTYVHHAQGDAYELGITEALCKTDDERTKVLAAIHAFTEECTDLRRGEYWGEVLVPSPR